MPDTIGQIFWFGSLATPLIAIPLFWREKSMSKVSRITWGLLTALVLSAIFIFTGLSILLRNGLGPS